MLRKEVKYKNKINEKNADKCWKLKEKSKKNYDSKNFNKEQGIQTKT